MQHDEATLRYATAKGYINACIMIFRSDEYEEARELGLPDVEGLEVLKSHLAAPHVDFTFRYIKPGNEMNNTNWPLTSKIFYELDNQVDTFLEASAAQGMKPGH
jgi:hypothetical protein